MHRKLQAATIVTATAAMFAVPTAAFAGTRGHSTCTESFARWHTDLEPIPGGYVTIDFGRDGVDYTTTTWETTSVIGLGELFAGNTIRVQWHAEDGTIIGEKGNGVVIEVDNCSPSEVTVPPTDAPSPTEAPVVTEPAPAVTEAAPAADPTTTAAIVAPTEAPIVAEVAAPPTTAAAAPSTTATVLVEAAGPLASTALPATGARDKVPYVVVGMSLLGAGLALAGFARRRSYV